MRKFWYLIARWISTTFGLGLFPVAPGTIGSAVAIIGLWFLPPVTIVIWLPLLVVFFLIGVYTATIAEKTWGHDAGRINYDEVIGMAVAVIAVPKYYLAYIFCFIAFRLFDILKPFPVNASQKLPHGWGVMMDDVVAGTFSNIIVQIIFRLLIKFPIHAC